MAIEVLTCQVSVYTHLLIITHHVISGQLYYKSFYPTDTTDSYALCNIHPVIQCPDKVEVAEDDGSVVVCASADLSGVPSDIDERGTLNVTTADDTAIGGKR